MSQSWSARIFDDGDTRARESILALLKRSKENWSWEYENNPFGHLIGIVRAMPPWTLLEYKSLSPDFEEFIEYVCKRRNEEKV